MEERPIRQNSRSRAPSWQYPRRAKFERELRHAAVAWFEEKGLQRHPRYPYCLAKWDQWPANIIVPTVAEYIRQVKQKCEEQGRPFPLHKWVHHGLSSQAMLFNLIGPLVVENDLEPLANAFEQHGLAWPSGPVAAAFEYEDRAVFNEDSGQPTSIDLVVTQSNVPRMFIESKLVEREFGGCPVFLDGDCDGRNPACDFSRCYLHHIGRRYWIVLESLGFLDGRIATDSMCVLANHYQFFREVGLAVQKNGAFVLLSDERSPTFWCDGPHGTRGLVAFLLESVPDSLRSRIGRVSIQQLAALIRASGRHPWIAEFEKKYGLAGRT